MIVKAITKNTLALLRARGLRSECSHCGRLLHYVWAKAGAQVVSAYWCAQCDAPPPEGKHPSIHT